MTTTYEIGDQVFIRSITHRNEYFIVCCIAKVKLPLLHTFIIGGHPNPESSNEDFFGESCDIDLSLVDDCCQVNNLSSIVRELVRL